MTLYDPKEIERAMRPKEHGEQAAFFETLHADYLRDYPEIHPLFFAVPNGIPLPGKRNNWQRFAIINKMKREGMTPGVADTLFLSGRGGAFGLAMEFKRPFRRNEKNGGLEESQLEFLRSVRMEGYRAEVAYGADHAEQIVRDYLAKPRTQDMIYAALKAAEKGDADTAARLLHEVTLAW
jgi:hypothetical protein